MAFRIWAGISAGFDLQFIERIALGGGISFKMFHFALDAYKVWFR
jgi:hypothetical protein